MPLDVRPIDAETHRAFVDRAVRVLPAAARRGPGSRRSGDGSRSAGSTATASSGPASSCCAGPPRIERYLAYLPEGPVIDWTAYDVADVLSPC